MLFYSSDPVHKHNMIQQTLYFAASVQLAQNNNAWIWYTCMHISNIKPCWQASHYKYHMVVMVERIYN